MDEKQETNNYVQMVSLKYSIQHLSGVRYTLFPTLK